jgi:hypothetical protein
VDNPVIVSESGNGQVVIPGDPDELEAAARVYATAAGGMSDAAGQLRSSLGTAAAWQGAGAEAHAVRAQALAAGHQVARDAFYLASQALAVYAQQLRTAQQLAAQANAANTAADSTAFQLGTVTAREATASTHPPGEPGSGRFGPIGAATSPYQSAVAQARALQSTLRDQQNQAGNLTNQTLQLAAAAAHQAASAFTEIAQMAGNPTAHNATDPWTAYLGFTPPGETAAMLEASGLKLGTVGMNKAAGDTNALTDLAADPAHGQNAKLATLDLKRDANYASSIPGLVAWLLSHGMKGLPGGFYSLPGPTQAVLLALRERQLRQHPGDPSWLGIASVGLHVVSFGLGGAAAVLGVASLLQGGTDPLTDVATFDAEGVSEEIAADAADDASEATIQKLLRSPKSLYTLGSSTAGGLATVTDASEIYLTHNWDPTVIVLDTLATIPGMTSVFTEVKAASITTDIASVNDQIEEASAAQLIPLQARLALLTGSQQSTTSWEPSRLASVSIRAGRPGSSAWPPSPSPPVDPRPLGARRPSAARLTERADSAHYRAERSGPSGCRTEFDNARST